MQSCVRLRFRGLTGFPAAFDSTYGKSPLIFINNRIILEAKRLVLYSDLMIKEIAYMLGYDDPSYFVKHFKRHTGYLPSEFREMER